MRIARTLAVSIACGVSGLLIGTLAGLPAGAAGAGEPAAVSLDPDLWNYRRTAGPVSGTLASRGSDTMNALMTLWAEGFARYHPTARVEVEGDGSSTAPAALTAAVAQCGAMCRVMTTDEVAAFASARGHAPTPLRACMDALAVFVDHENFVEGLSLEQVDGIFSSTRRRGGADIDTWDEVGLRGDYTGAAIRRHGLAAASRVHGFFAASVLRRGAPRDSLARHPHTRDVVEAVTGDRLAIGYGRLTGAGDGVRAVPLSSSVGDPPITPTYADIATGAYPLGRSLLVYVDKPPNAPLSPLLREFMRFVLSREGQAAAVADGFLPLDERACAVERAKLD